MNKNIPYDPIPDEDKIPSWEYEQAISRLVDLEPDEMSYFMEKCPPSYPSLAAARSQARHNRMARNRYEIAKARAGAKYQHDEPTTAEILSELIGFYREQRGKDVGVIPSPETLHTEARYLESLYRVERRGSDRAPDPARFEQTHWEFGD